MTKSKGVGRGANLKGDRRPIQPTVSIHDTIEVIAPDGTREQRRRTDLMLSGVRAGNWLSTCAKANGVEVNIVEGWIATGRRTIRAIVNGARTEDQLTDYEHNCRLFARAVDEAESGWELRANLILDQLCNGGLTTRKTTTKIKYDRLGAEIEREVTETVETALPSLAAITWRLQRKNPKRYYVGSRLENPLPEETPLTVPEADRARSIADDMKVYLQARLDMEAEQAKTAGSNGSNGHH